VHSGRRLIIVVTVRKRERLHVSRTRDLGEVKRRVSGRGSEAAFDGPGIEGVEDPTIFGNMATKKG